MARFEEVTVSDRMVELTDSLYFLKMAIVSRKDIKDLDDQWQCPGIYVLVDGWADSWCAYVGKTTQLSTRIPQDRKFEWNRALIVRRSAAPFDTTEIGWLEGRIHGLLEARGVELKNVQKPQDDTLNVARQRVLENYVGVIQDALVLLGYDPAGRQQQISARTAELEPEETTPATIGKVHLKLLDVVKSGTQIESTSRKYPATATVEPRGIRYQDELFGSPSAAAKAVTGQDTADGWSFWGVRRSDSDKVVMLKALKVQRETGGIAAAVTGTAQRSATDGPRSKTEGRPSPSRGKTTPKKMSPATVRRLLARKDEGATYVQLMKEFGLTQGSVYSLLLENGRVTQR